ncbi:glycosyl transferase family 41-domain-containing protein, partial [Blyttiomyces helicus]
MQSVFGLHDRNRFRVFCYALTPSDDSPYRAKIEREADVFVDCSGWQVSAIVDRIARIDGIHVLCNLNGYTKGGRNEIFAARAAPVQMAFMGFAGTMGAGPIACPRRFVCGEPLPASHLEPTSASPSSSTTRGPIHPTDDRNRIYTEGLIYMPHTYFANDHRQGFREKPDEEVDGIDELTGEERVRWRREQVRRLKMRAEVFPWMGEETVIYANFNQLYKVDPEIFATWVNIIKRVPNSILWLLRFPPAGEAHLRRKARELVGEEVARRLVFTDVAPKHLHIHRGRIADVFLDTPECNAHTTAADILWSGSPIITYPKHDFKMCSRVAASIAYATGSWPESDNRNLPTRVTAAPTLPPSQRPSPTTPPFHPSRHSPTHILVPSTLTATAPALRRRLFLTRDQIPLFDTPRWVRNLEAGMALAWTDW